MATYEFSRQLPVTKSKVETKFAQQQNGILNDYNKRGLKLGVTHLITTSRKFWS